MDEFQDLTPQQLRVVNRIGWGKTTYAGDLAQGIYGFAGAKPLEIDAAVRAECSALIEFTESHRSSPAVLELVNTLVPLTGGQLLTSADPESWPSGGLVAAVGHGSVKDEADWIVATARAILSRAPEQRVGVLARTTNRRRFVDAAFMDSDVTHFRWDDGVLDTDSAKIVKNMLLKFDLRGFMASKDQVEFLRAAAGFESVTDPSGRESLADALAWCYDLLRDGVLPEGIRRRVKVGDSSTLISVAGVHLLNGHVGKGQQFDWVIVAGTEDGVVPNFNAATKEEVAEEARVLSVMLSRARHGAILTYSTVVPTLKGALRAQEPSRFFKGLAGAGLKGADGLIEWVDDADWAAIAAR